MHIHHHRELLDAFLLLLVLLVGIIIGRRSGLLVAALAFALSWYFTAPVGWWV